MGSHKPLTSTAFWKVNALSGLDDRLYFVAGCSEGLEGNLGLRRSNWEAQQADRYILFIRDACEVLAEGRKRGRAIDDIRPGYQRLGAQSHFLFYGTTAAGLIDVVRILHGRMDAAAASQGLKPQEDRPIDTIVSRNIDDTP